MSSEVLPWGDDPVGFFGAMMTPEPNTGCHLWLGAVRGKPGYEYPVIRVKGRWYSVARMILGLTKPYDRAACHRCDTPLCINPKCLFVGTLKDNAQDMIAKGRMPSAIKTHCKNGHLFSPENTYDRSAFGSGRRQCRKCNAAAVARSKIRRINRSNP